MIVQDSSVAAVAEICIAHVCADVAPRCIVFDSGEQQSKCTNTSRQCNLLSGASVLHTHANHACLAASNPWISNSDRTNATPQRNSTAPCPFREKSRTCNEKQIHHTTTTPLRVTQHTCQVQLIHPQLHITQKLCQFDT
jgi:hypothetical protein